MFGSLMSMMYGENDYPQRVVANFEAENRLIVDTAAVDGFKPYETAVKHPHYRNGRWIIVEAYDTREEAQVGHEKWVAAMTADTLPSVLVDCINDSTMQEFVLRGGAYEFPRVEE